MTIPTAEEVQQMLAVAREFLREAQDNSERRNFRSAITAAYYAVYHAARAALATKGVATRTHKGLIQQFGKHFMQTKSVSAEHGQTLTDLHDERQAADYLAMTGSLEEAAVHDSVQRAESFVNAVEEAIKSV